MKTCKNGDRGVHVKIMQSYLRYRGFTNNNGNSIGVDGVFGPSSEQALIKFQKSVFTDKDDWDGSCGPGTWRKLAFYEPSKTNQNLWVQKIPLKNISKFDVHITNGVKTTLLQHNKVNRDFITLNAIFFSNGSPLRDPYYYWNLTDLVIDGVLQKYGGNYSNIGIAIDKNVTPYRMYQSTTAECVGKKGIDFVAGTPPTIQNGIIKYDNKGLSTAFISAKGYRWGYGFTADGCYVRVTTALNSDQITIADLTAEAKAQGCVTFIVCDGGGSLAEAVANNYMYNQGRPVPTAFGINIKF